MFARARQPHGMELGLLGTKPPHEKSRKINCPKMGLNGPQISRKAGGSSVRDLPTQRALWVASLTLLEAWRHYTCLYAKCQLAGQSVFTVPGRFLLPHFVLTDKESKIEVCLCSEAKLSSN
jgi:hypothetical protein